jgi:tetratricopeptide (TPR) repeat protein
LSKQRYQDSLALLRELGDPKDIAHALDGLGYVCWIRGEYQESKQHNEEMLTLSKEIGDQRGIAGSLGSLGIVTYGLRDFQKSREFILESIALYKELGHSWGVADRLGDLGELALAMGEYTQAAQFAQESNAVYARVVGEFHNWGLRVIGNAALGLGDLQTARKYLCLSLQHALKIHRWGHALLVLVVIAGLLAKEGKEERAFELLALVMSHRASWQMGKDKALPLIAELEAKLPPEVVAAAQARGLARDLDATIQELLTELEGEEMDH